MPWFPLRAIPPTKSLVSPPKLRIPPIDTCSGCPNTLVLRKKDTMTDDKEKYVGRTSGRIGAGIFLLLIGSVLLLDQMGVPLPHWLFSWHLLLIAIGIFIGLRHGFRGGAWLIMILIGAYFLAQDYYPDLPMRRFIWPGSLIFIGLAIILGPRRHGRRWR